MSNSFFENTNPLNSPNDDRYNQSPINLNKVIFYLLEAEKGINHSSNCELLLVGMNCFNQWNSCQIRLNKFINQLMKDEMDKAVLHNEQVKTLNNLNKEKCIIDLEIIAQSLSKLFKEEVSITTVIGQFNSIMLSLEEKYASIFI